MSQFNNENVLALKTDTTDSRLLAGDTQGFISVFDIKNYCTSSQVCITHLINLLAVPTSNYNVYTIIIYETLLLCCCFHYTRRS